MPQSIHDLPTPSLLVDADRLERNLRRMQAHCDRLGVALRPHIKTHKCLEIGRMQRDFGAVGITASTLYEAEAFAADGFDDITWAFPLILSRAAQAVALSRRAKLGLVVDSAEAVEALATAGVRLEVWMKVDCGYHRAGVDPDSDLPLRLVESIAAGGHRFAGLLSHSGNAYDATDEQQREAIAERERSTIVALAESLRAAGHEVPAVSVGSTPGTSAATHLEGVTEVRPGNYACFDLTQVRIGSCAADDCAMTVITSVVSRSPAHSIVDAGALALSKDPGIGPPTMGAIYDDYDQGTLHPTHRLTSLSQEHGKLSTSLRVGTRLRVLPNHSCLAAACFPECHAVRGDEVIASWKIFNGR